MRFTFGTAIFIFLALFIVAMVSFAIFAYNQDVNLVHSDYYEKGVDYSQQLDCNERSARFAPLIQLSCSDDSVIVDLPAEVSSKTGSVSFLLFRPSDHNLDRRASADIANSQIAFPRQGMQPGRYIVKLNWVADGLNYEVDKELIMK